MSKVSALASLFSRVVVKSCADGTMRVEPVWKRKLRKTHLPPGVFTRMSAAKELEKVINARLKGR